jgi:hypothetical protein
MGKIRPGHFLEYKDVMRLLRSEIERAGGQTAWAKMAGVDRPDLNKALGWTKPLSKSVIKALNLRIVYAPNPNGSVPEKKAPARKAVRPGNAIRREKRARPTGRGAAS